MLAATLIIVEAGELINRLCQPQWFLVVCAAGLALLLLGHQWLTKPLIAALLAVLAVVAFALSASDPYFRSIVTRPDNVAIVLLLFAAAFFLWLSFRRASLNDRRTAKGEPLLEAGADDHVLVWPDLVMIELIAIALGTGLLVVWAMLVPAPLEQPADPSTAPNPAKAPWYFLGLQELLVYFDPWLAGVVIPGLAVFGLLAIPYIDKNPRGNGYYTFKERPLAISVFLFGFMILWLMPIVIGTFLRGPNWNFFGPFEPWEPNRPTGVVNADVAHLFWIELLDRPLPQYYLMRELPGIVFLAGYYLLGPFVLRLACLREVCARMGWIRYTIMVWLSLTMVLIVIKMVLRWTLNIQYIVAIREWSLNV